MIYALIKSLALTCLIYNGMYASKILSEPHKSPNKTMKWVMAIIALTLTQVFILIELLGFGKIIQINKKTRFLIDF